MSSTNKLTCCVCNKKILLEDKAVELRTFINVKDIENKFFHFNCWLKALNLGLEKKMKKLVDDGFELIENVLS